MSIEPKVLVWIGSTRRDLRSMPVAVKRSFGLAQIGGMSPNARPLSGFGSAGVLELTEDHRGDTYRAIYTVRFATRVYVLHVFQKKAKRGIATPRHEIDIIRDPLRIAGQMHAEAMTET